MVSFVTLADDSAVHAFSRVAAKRIERILSRSPPIVLHLYFRGYLFAVCHNGLFRGSTDPIIALRRSIYYANLLFIR